ncbi:MAG: sugar phosphate isomerase/epimerase [Pyrinomonadaceae bacterium]
MRTPETFFSRRRFLQLGAGTATGLWAAGNVPRALAGSAKTLKNIGVQLYTVRDLMPKDAPGTLKALAGLGYKEVEVIGRNLDQLAPELQRVGLKPISMHIEAALVTGNRETLKAIAARFNFPMLPDDYTLSSAIANAKKHGVEYLVVSYLFPQERGGADFYRQFADQMNRAGEQCRAAGLKLCYHNHAFEFAPVESIIPFDLFMERFDARLVSWEMDVFWIAMGGQDPAVTLRKYKGRVPLVHLKDKAKAIAGQTDEAKVPPTAFAEVGNGGLNFAEILRAAEEAGVRHYFVEQDQTAGNPLDSLRQSYAYLNKLNF